MKKVFTLVSVMLMAVASLSAQQSLWGGQTAKSPEINPDNSVTFRLVAPKAVKVQVGGDFVTPVMGEVNGMAMEVTNPVDMKEVNGVWEYTTEPLASELYSYYFIVDGMTIKDPSNVYMIRDVNSVTNVFIIPGDKGDIYSVQDVPHGTVAKRWYDSPTLGLTRRMTVYTPAGYETSKEKYPVFYLFHGSGGDEESWMDLGRTAQILDNLIAQGKAKPMIVVVTNGNPAQEAAAGYSDENFAYTPAMGGGTRGGVATFPESFKDVQKFIEANYRTINKKSARAVAGLSMGGGHTFTISKDYPNTFDYVGIFSASGQVTDETRPQLQAMQKNGYSLYVIACGNTDFVYNGAINYHKQLTEMGFEHELWESGGGHIWRNWRIYLTDFAQRIFK